MKLRPRCHKGSEGQPHWTIWWICLLVYVTYRFSPVPNKYPVSVTCSNIIYLPFSHMPSWCSTIQNQTLCNTHRHYFNYGPTQSVIHRFSGQVWFFLAWHTNHLSRGSAQLQASWGHNDHLIHLCPIFRKLSSFTNYQAFV